MKYAIVKRGCEFQTYPIAALPKIKNHKQGLRNHKLNSNRMSKQGPDKKHEAIAAATVERLVQESLISTAEVVNNSEDQAIPEQSATTNTAASKATEEVQVSTTPQEIAKWLCEPASDTEKDLTEEQKVIQRFSDNDLFQAAVLILRRAETISPTSLERMFSLLPSSLAPKIIRTLSTANLKIFLPYMSGLDSEAAISCLESSDPYLLFEHIDNFLPLSNKVALCAFGTPTGREVFRHESHFQAWDKEVALVAIESRIGVYPLKHPEKFEGFRLNNEVAQLAIQNGLAILVAEKKDSFEGFKGFSKNEAMIMLEIGQDKEFVSLIQEFSGLDAEVAYQAIKIRAAYSVIQHKDRFAGFRLNKETALVLVQAGFSELLVGKIDSFEGLDAEVALVLAASGRGREIMKKLTAFGSAANDAKFYSDLIDLSGADLIIKFGTEQFFEAMEATRDLKRKIILYTLLNYPSERIAGFIRRWETKPLERFIRIIGGARFQIGYSKMIEPLIEKLIRESKQDNNSKLLKELSSLINLYDPYGELRTRVDSDLQDINEEDQDEHDGELYGFINFSNEIVSFYIYEQLRHEVQLFLEAHSSKLSLKEKVALNDLIQRLKTNISSIFNWIKPYIVKATNSELSLQSQLQDPLNDLETNTNLNAFLQGKSNEDVRVFLYKAAARFNMEGFGWALTKETTKGFAGPSWEQIAKLGYEMWRSNPRTTEEEIMLIDRAFDLEHNSGGIFDKDRMISYDSQQQQEILDKKASHRGNVAELFTELESELTDTRLKTSLQSDINYLYRLKRKYE